MLYRNFDRTDKYTATDEYTARAISEFVSNKLPGMAEWANAFAVGYVDLHKKNKSALFAGLNGNSDARIMMSRSIINKNPSLLSISEKCRSLVINEVGNMSRSDQRRAFQKISALNGLTDKQKRQITGCAAQYLMEVGEALRQGKFRNGSRQLSYMTDVFRNALKIDPNFNADRVRNTDSRHGKLPRSFIQPDISSSSTKHSLNENVPTLDPRPRDRASRDAR